MPGVVDRIVILVRPHPDADPEPVLPKLAAVGGEGG